MEEPTYPEFVNQLFNWSPDQSKNFTHAVLGIVTEIHEYLCAEDELNGLEELGDLAFYVEALAQTVARHTGTSPHVASDGEECIRLMELSDRAEGGAATVIADLCNTLLDDAKRWIGYGKEPRSLQEVFSTCVDLVSMVNLTGPYPCADLQRIRAANMRKLYTRYPGAKFNAQHAVVRNVEAERVVLQAD